MTARHAGYVIALEDDIREDDAEHLLNAIRCLRGVARVEPVGGDPLAAQIGAMRMHTKLSDDLVAVIHAHRP